MLDVLHLLERIRELSRRHEYILSIWLADHLITGLRQGQNLLFRCKLRWGKQIIFVVFLLFKMLRFLFAVQHLPALDAEHLAVRFALYNFKFWHEVLPLWRASLYHVYKRLYFSSFVFSGIVGLRYESYEFDIKPKGKKRTPKISFLDKVEDAILYDSRYLKFPGKIPFSYADLDVYYKYWKYAI